MTIVEPFCVDTLVLFPEGDALVCSHSKGAAWGWPVADAKAGVNFMFSYNLSALEPEQVVCCLKVLKCSLPLPTTGTVVAA
jgi:hypothetical protein